MAAPACNTCPSLRRQVAQLTGRVVHLERQVEHLRHWLAWTLAGLRAVLGFIDREQTEPTLARRDLVPAIGARLTYIADTAEGKN